jgi:hypothetical protein
MEKNQYYYINNFLNQINNYSDEITNFCQIYKITIDKLKKNKLFQFKFICFYNNKFIKDIKIDSKDSVINSKEAVLIYFNNEPHIEFIIRNMIITLGNNWTHRIICSNNNYNFISSIISKISNNIKIIKLNVDNASSIIKNHEIWYEFDGNKILFYDENTILYDKNINSFIDYDIITNLYNEETLLHNLTLRNKMIMIESLNNYNNDIPEHVFSYRYFINKKYKVPNIINTQKFFNNINNNNSLSFDFFKLLNKYRKTIYIISNIKGGGTLKYINDLISNYKDYVQIFIINDREQLINNFYFDNDLIMVQQLFNTNILLEDILNIKKVYKSKIIISIHDFYWLSSNIVRELNIDNPYWHYEYINNPKVSNLIINFFNNSDLVIHPSKFTFNIYSKYFDNNNFKFVYHNDYTIKKNKRYIPIIIDNTINIGFLHDYNNYKGKESIDILINKYKVFNNYKINFFIKNVNIPSYNPNDFFEYIKKYNIHCLTLLNKWGETYCYALTLFINSGLPIIYNNFGAIKERIEENDNYFKVYDDESECNNNDILYTQFEKLLKYIINNNGLFHDTGENEDIIYNNFYDYLFNKKNDYSIVHNKIKPICIYFPQFHKIIENDHNYYENMTDIHNLHKYLEESNNEENLETPKMSNYDLYNLLSYNLLNNQIIEKQIEIAKKNGIYGFGIYYYWFSNNDITGINTIMNDCYNIFFNKYIHNFKVFFIWANEDWSKNPAFNSSLDIKNIYNEENFIYNIKNLVLYFKHDNYYKINNRPVFYIHHPWFITIDKINLFYTLLNKECIKNKLDNVYLCLNSIDKKYENFHNYDFNPNYKNKKDYNIKVNDRNTIDYSKYLKFISTNSTSNNQGCIFFNFNNTARLFIPDKLNLRTSVINNNIFNQTRFLDIVFNNYESNKNDEIEKILLINSWNEWGENMAVEPSEENNELYLNMIKFKLLKFIN